MCYQCVCPECYQCVCPLHTPSLSPSEPSEGERVRAGTGVMRALVRGCFSGLALGVVLSSVAAATPLLPPRQVGHWLKMTNANVRLEYDLSTGRANFYWQDALKLAGFYSGVRLTSYVTSTLYSNRSWVVTNNEVDVTLTGSGLPTMKQVFILDQDKSFLTRVEAYGVGLQSRWMAPVVMDTTGGGDIGSYDDDRV